MNKNLYLNTIEGHRPTSQAPKDIELGTGEVIYLVPRQIPAWISYDNGFYSKKSQFSYNISMNWTFVNCGEKFDRLAKGRTRNKGLNQEVGQVVNHMTVGKLSILCDTYNILLPTKYHWVFFDYLLINFYQKSFIT